MCCKTSLEVLGKLGFERKIILKNYINSLYIVRTYVLTDVDSPIGVLQVAISALPCSALPSSVSNSSEEIWRTLSAECNVM